MRAERAEQILEYLSAPLLRQDCLTHVERIPARPGRTGTFPAWTDPRLITHLAERGITAPWTHQERAAELAHDGQHVVLATSTASGKSLAYMMPIMTAIGARDLDPTAPRATALYVAPTKALAADQLASITSLADGAGIRAVRAAVHDGDTPPEQRRWNRRHATLVLTNPDMLHYGILPGHEQWAHLLRSLRYVVVDECHSYRGVFGAHVAWVLRRLRRIAARYRAEPTFILASATSAAPGVTASRLIGADVEEITEDGSPRSALTIGLWEPGSRQHTDDRPNTATPAAGTTGRHVTADRSKAEHAEDALRRSATSEAGALLADLVAEGVQTLVFARSRRGAELVAAAARRLLADMAEQRMSADLADRGRRIAAYRGGYLASERRELERALRSGELTALASTNALELGIDVSGLDAVVLAGWPGTRASFWQQIGRAGRTRDADAGALALFIAREDPLDTYVARHPDTVLGAEVEASVFDPANPYVMTPHLCAAAAELPLREHEPEQLGQGVRELLATLTERGALRRRPAGWYWTLPSSAHDLTDLRGSGGEPVRIIDGPTGALLGTVDAASAHTQVHDGAVYIHQGRSYVVDRLDVDLAVAMVHAEQPLHTTHPQSTSSIAVRQVRESEDFGGGTTQSLGTVDVTDHVTGYQVRDVYTQVVLAQHPLDLPPRTLTTTAVWWELPEPLIEAAGITAEELPGALHAAEHAAISMLPLLATCDRWDIGGVSTALHEDTGTPTIFVYDGAPGGAGFAERGMRSARPWLRATADMIRECPCSAGCPACVVSPKCGNGNEPLSKSGALRLLDHMLSASEAS